MELYALDYKDDGSYELDLTPENVERLTDGRIKADRVQGMFGGSAGKLTIAYDQYGDMSWEDVDPDLTGSDEGVIVEPNGRWTCTNQADQTNPHVEAVVAAYNELHGRYDGDQIETILSRYAALHGMKVSFDVLPGQSQSDWLDVVFIYPASQDEARVKQPYVDYWAGDVYNFSYEIESPIEGIEDGHEAYGGFIGDEHVLTNAAIHIESEINHIGNQIRKLKQEASDVA